MGGCLYGHVLFLVAEASLLESLLDCLVLLVGGGGGGGGGGGEA